MVTIVWLILSLIGVCSFSWWPVLIESLLFMLIGLAGASDGGSKFMAVIGLVMAGVFPFAAFKLFCGLNLSLWWLIAAPFWNVIAAAVPGGYTISAIFMERYGWMTVLPTWMLVVLILLDILYLVGIIMGIIEWRNDKKTAGRAGR